MKCKVFISRKADMENMLKYVCFIGFYVTPTKYRFQPYWWRKTSCALPCIISGTNGHLSRTTDV
jgi:hypothetical protein